VGDDEGRGQTFCTALLVCRLPRSPLEGPLGTQGLKSR
jgi:hypothetical protein